MIGSLIAHPLGLFKDSVGEKILFINKVESQHTTLLAHELIKYLHSNPNSFIDKIIIGSLKEKRYRLVSR